MSEQTQVTLILCGPLLASKQKGEAPLSPGEFNKLCGELEKQGVALLGSKASQLMQNLPVEIERAQIETRSD